MFIFLRVHQTYNGKSSDILKFSNLRRIWLLKNQVTFYLWYVCNKIHYCVKSFKNKNVLTRNMPLSCYQFLSCQLLEHFFTFTVNTNKLTNKHLKTMIIFVNIHEIQNSYWLSDQLNNIEGDSQNLRLG